MGSWKSAMLGLLAGFSLALLLLSGCGTGSSSTKQNILTKAEKCKTKEELQQALGKPSGFESAEVPILGPPVKATDAASGQIIVVQPQVGLEPREKWTYKASDGEVTFTISKGKIIGRMIGESKKK